MKLNQKLLDKLLLEERQARNKLIFDRAISLVMQEYGKTREEVLAWLQDDTDATFAEMFKIPKT